VRSNYAYVITVDFYFLSSAQFVKIKPVFLRGNKTFNNYSHNRADKNISCSDFMNFVMDKKKAKNLLALSYIFCGLCITYVYNSIN
jgi:hypothetical protein